MNINKNNMGIYIHVPFCKSKCPYCNFYSVPFSGNKEYVGAVCTQIENWGKKLKNTADTIYFGGGTPSLLSSEFICRMINCIKNNFKTKNSEITLEVNPADYQSVDFEKLKFFGVNRISVGAQSICEKELKALGRRHDANDILKTVYEIKKANIHNISLDLMLAIPYQTRASISEFAEFCAQSRIKHISAYLLKLEKGTPFYQKKLSLNVPDEDESADIYEYACKIIEKNGYNQYEISNFSVPGFESRHNLKYWNLCEYLGIGPSAHSLINGKRFYYKNSVNDFVISPKICAEGKFEPQKEYIMLRLRLKEGLKNSLFKEKFNKDIPKICFEKAKKYETAGLTWCTKDKMGITPKGFLVSNAIISEILG